MRMRCMAIEVKPSQTLQLSYKTSPINFGTQVPRSSTATKATGLVIVTAKNPQGVIQMHKLTHKLMVTI